MLLKLYYTLLPADEFDSYAINVFELSSTQDPGVLIETVVINPLTDYIEVTLASSRYSWFRLQVTNQAGTETLDATHLTLSEVGGLRVLEIREAVKDTRRPDPAFSDQELLEKLELAAMRLNNVRNLDSVAPKYWPIIELLVRSDICSVLAFDYAKYLKLEIPGGATLHRDELYTHYIKVKDSLEKYYSALQRDLAGEMSEAGDGEVASNVHVATMSRLSFETGVEETSLDAYIRFPYTGTIDEFRKQFSKLY